MSETPRSVTLKNSRDVAYARQAAATAMAEINASPIKRTKFVTAVSEVARNAVIYGKGGVISFELTTVDGRQRVVATCSDRGPGIDDIAAALKDGFSTGKSLGLGLGGAKRLVDRFEIVSSRSSGTNVTLECAAR